MESKIKLLEVFPSFQGEGLYCGQLATFLRFASCNLNCSYCDTMSKMKYQPEAYYDIEDLIILGKKTNQNYVITGGEPTLTKYHDDILNIMSSIDYNRIEIETNGFQIVNLLGKLINNLSKDKLDKILINYSPKIFNDVELPNVITQVKKNINFMDNNNINWILKIVAFDYKNSFTLTDEFLNHIIIKQKIDSKKVFLMPEGVSRESILIDMKQYQELCFIYSCNFSTRMHILHNFI